MLSLFIRFGVYILLITPLLSQNVNITGTVINPVDKPVKKAVITLRNLKDEIIQEDITNRKGKFELEDVEPKFYYLCLLYTSPSPRDRTRSRMPSSA